MKDEDALQKELEAEIARSPALTELKSIVLRALPSLSDTATNAIDRATTPDALKKSLSETLRILALEEAVEETAKGPSSERTPKDTELQRKVRAVLRALGTDA